MRRMRRRAFDRLESESGRNLAAMGGKRAAPHPDHEAFFAALGRRIKELRKERGWSLHKMVAEFGYYDAQWRKYEKGSAITIDGILKMCSIFNVTLRELIDHLGEFPRRDMRTVAAEQKAGSVEVGAAKRTSEKMPVRRVQTKTAHKKRPARKTV